MCTTLGLAIPNDEHRFVHPVYDSASYSTEDPLTKRRFGFADNQCVVLLGGCDDRVCWRVAAVDLPLDTVGIDPVFSQPLTGASEE